MSSINPAPVSTSEKTGGNDSPSRQAPVQDATKSDISADIDPANEVQGPKLVLIHFAVCLCTFLIGLVSARIYSRLQCVEAATIKNF